MVHMVGGLLYDDGEVEADPRRVKGAPHRMVGGRLDEARAARH